METFNTDYIVSDDNGSTYVSEVVILTFVSSITNNYLTLKSY